MPGTVKYLLNELLLSSQTRGESWQLGTGKS